MITAIDKNTVLILIDLQNGIVNSNIENNSKQVIVNANKLIAAFRMENLPIIAVHVNPFNAPFLNLRVEKSNIPKDEEGRKQALEKMTAADFFSFVPGLDISENDLVILKNSWNAFNETCLNELLQERSITGIVLAGISTSIGVESTARTANEKGYNIGFVKDAMTDSVLAAHENSLKYIFPRIGEIGATDEIIDKLTQRGKTSI